MGNITKLEEMKEDLVQLFSEYIKDMNEVQLYHFLSAMDSDSFLESLSEDCKEIKLPRSVLTCEKCEELYGSCEGTHVKNDLIRVCVERFKKYCKSAANE